LEANLLAQLAAADPATILDNKELIESLEQTKETSNEIKEKTLIAEQTEININNLREVYRRVAAEGAMLYFLLIQLNVVDAMYQYSLEAFQTFFFKAIERTDQFEEEEHRVIALRECIRLTIYTWVSRGLFERHLMIFLAQLTFRLMQKKVINVDYTDKDMSFLLNCPMNPSVPKPDSIKDWMPDTAWFSMQKLIELEGFENFAQNVEKEAPKKFEDWYNEIAPEGDKLPLDWRKLEGEPFKKLLVVRCLRPDRMTTALGNFIEATLPNGKNYTECDQKLSQSQILQAVYDDSTNLTPMYFILSPGANPVLEVQKLGKANGIDINKQLHSVALGDGQDIVALNKLELGHKDGHWIFLQNIQLMPDFLKALEKVLDAYALEGSHQQFRLYLSSDPVKSIPIGLLERSIKLTNEPPSGLKANMKRAIVSFNKEEFDERDQKIRTILFGLCYFHSVMLERRKFGAKGWNRAYPFSAGDLRDSSIVLNNYLEANQSSGKTPWEDLKYIFGEIMYGGHITDDWDRVLCATYLDSIMKDDLFDDVELFPFVDREMFKCPVGQTFDRYLEHIDEAPPETPNAYGLHSNAEIDCRTKQCDVLFKTLQEI
jgi:dynein heavy chain